MLQTEALTRRFGGITAVDHVSLQVDAGSLHAVIGPNGAGKSTLFHLVSGRLRPDGGRILFEGRRIDHLPAYARARLGIAIAFQAARIFRGMTALENVMVGAHAWTRHGFLEAALRLPLHGREEAAALEEARAALDRVGQSLRADLPAESLALGQQRAVQMARALCGRPRVLLLDEPASGLRAAEREVLVGLLRQLKAEGMTILLIEHDVPFVSRLADTVTVMDVGRVIAEGTPADIQRHPAVVAAYLGGELGTESA